MYIKTLLVLCLVVYSRGGLNEQQRKAWKSTRDETLNISRTISLYEKMYFYIKQMNDINECPIIRSPSGVFSGSWMSSRRGRRFQAYRGIRYAESPVGELRYQPPKPILRYEGVVDATDDAPQCPQPSPPGYPVSEDCLTINVYTPSTTSRPLPVIVYIHAGGFYAMNGRSDLVGPQYLLDKNVVLVTINHRLGSLGFLSLGTKEAPGNNGYQDQVAALRWVRRNIASFGGNPDLVTIAGCSAGAISVVVHMISPMSKGLFHRAIAMSGSPISKVPLPSERLDLAFKQARMNNCPTGNLTELYLCLKTKTWKELTVSVDGFLEFGKDPLILWRPVVEPDFGQERFLPIEPMDAIRQGKMHAVPILISMTRDELFSLAFNVLRNETLLDTMNREWERVAPISFILPRNNSSEQMRRLRQEYLGDRQLTDDELSADGLGKLYGDSITAQPVHRLATMMSRHSPEAVYYYKMAYIGNRSFFEDPETKRPVGVSHQDDFMYLFTSARFPTIEVSDGGDSRMVDTMTGIWHNFATYGDPNVCGPRNRKCLGIHWAEMTPARRSYLRVDAELSVHEDLFEDRFAVWDDLYPVQY